MNKKKYVAVIFGGFSPEHDISLKSAYGIIQNMDRSKYEVILIGITKKGQWLYYTGDPQSIPDGSWQADDAHCFPVSVSLERSKHQLFVFEKEGLRTIPIDIAFPVLHGANGEDGTLQGIFELAGIPVVGCDTLSSALCMDKYKSHQLAEAAGILVPRGLFFPRNTTLGEIRRQVRALTYPLFVKPVGAGSSFGITRVREEDEVDEAVCEAFFYDNQIIIEEAIDGFEVGCAVLGNRELTIGEVDEIELEGEWFDYTEKYTQKHSFIHMPARLEQAAARRVQDTAAAIYRALGCRGYARVDMFYTPEGKVYFNEVNTIPGMMECSRFPKMMKGIGLGFSDLIDKLIGLGLEPVRKDRWHV